MSFLEIKNLSKRYHHQGHVISALEPLSFDVQVAQTVAITGPSGAGKSTLLNLIGGLDQPTEGEVFFEGRSLSSLSLDELALFRQKKMGFIFQFHHLLEDFSVIENVMMPLLIQGQSQKSASKMARDFLTRVGLTHFDDRYPEELSGGEQQRVAIARALIHRPKLILADEPTGNLDDDNGQKVFKLLCELNRDLSAALIMVTHQPEFAKALQRHLHLEAGKIVPRVQHS